MRILTLDLGLGSLKACLWENDLLVARHAVLLTTESDGNRAEQDARDWWQAAIQAVRQVTAQANGAGNIDAIGLTGHMHALVPTGAGGEPLAPVATVSDRRARQACRELEARFGIGTILRWTGGRIDPTCALAKARHFHASGDPAWREARWILPPKDWLRFQLTGEAVTDPIDAAGTMLWNLEAQDWQPELCDFAGLAPARLPVVCPTISVAGTLTRQAADALGLPAGTPVATGGGDDIEALGAGALRPGDLYEHLGTTGSIYVCADRPRFDPQARVETYPDILPGRWLMGGSTSAAGLAVRWANALTGREEAWEKANALFERMAQEARPSGVTFLPYLIGERAPLWDADRSGALVGLRTSHGPDTILQATAEGVAFQLRAVLDSLAELNVVGPDNPVFSSGPLGANPDLGQTRADIYGRSVTHYGPSDDTTSRAAMVLAVCALTGENPYRRMAQSLKPVWTARPRPDAHTLYQRAYRKFQRVSDALAEFDGDDWDGDSDTGGN